MNIQAVLNDSPHHDLGLVTGGLPDSMTPLVTITSAISVMLGSSYIVSISAFSMIERKPRAPVFFALGHAWRWRSVLQAQRLIEHLPYQKDTDIA